MRHARRTALLALAAAALVAAGGCKQSQDGQHGQPAGAPPLGGYKAPDSTTDSAGGGYASSDSLRSPAAKKLSGTPGTGAAQDTSHR